MRTVTGDAAYHLISRTRMYTIVWRLLRPAYYSTTVLTRYLLHISTSLRQYRQQHTHDFGKARHKCDHGTMRCLEEYPATAGKRKITQKNLPVAANEHIKVQQ